ncbi:c-type cytochrome [Actinomycetota bacterium]
MKRYLPWIGIGALAVIMVMAVVGFGQSGSNSSAAEGSNELDAAAGEPLYQQHCAACHGSDLRGTAAGPSHLSIVYEPNHHGDATFALAIRNGARQHHWNFGDMPPVQGLTDNQIASITAYVRDQQRTHGFEPYPPP